MQLNSWVQGVALAQREAAGPEVVRGVCQELGLLGATLFLPTSTAVSEQFVEAPE